MIEIGPLMIPCRHCGAYPGQPCAVADWQRIRLKAGVSERKDPHRVRVNDATRTSRLLDS